MSDYEEEENKEDQEDFEEEPDYLNSDDPALIFADEVDIMNHVVRNVFRIDNEEHADWLVNKMRGIKRELADRKAAYLKHRKQLEKKLDFLDKRFSAELEDFTISQLQGRRKKSLTLPCGSAIGYRKQKGKLIIFDKQAYVQWALLNAAEHITDMEPVFDTAAIRDEALSTGEIPAGCEAVAAGDAFYVRLK